MVGLVPERACLGRIELVLVSGGEVIRCWGYGTSGMGYGIWDMGYGIWDMGYGVWDIGNGI